MSAREVILLGPQRLQPTLSTAIAALGLPSESRVATVTAGWQEREPDDQELNEHLSGRTVNLQLYRRAERVFAHDPEFTAAFHERQDRFRRMQATYRIRLEHAMTACRLLLEEHASSNGSSRLPSGSEEDLAREREAAIEAVRDLDRRHAASLRDVHQQFEATFQPAARGAILREQSEIADLMKDTSIVAIAGGHVAVLLNRLRMFDLSSLLGDRAVVAWSAGAMAIADRVVLFHDRPPHGPGHPEVLENGFGLAPGIVPFPHARRRLDLTDSLRVQLGVRRFEPARCVALDEGTGVRRQGEDWRPLPTALQLGTDGTVRPWVPA